MNLFTGTYYTFLIEFNLLDLEHSLKFEALEHCPKVVVQQNVTFEIIIFYFVYLIYIGIFSYILGIFCLRILVWKS